MVRRPIIAAALAAAVAGPGCGEDEEETFRKEFPPVNGRIVDLRGDVVTALSEAPGKSDRQIAAEFGRLAKRADALRGEADGLEPPGELESPHEDLTRALGDMSDGLERIDEAATKHDVGAGGEGTQKVLAAGQLVDSRSSALARETGPNR